MLLRWFSVQIRLDKLDTNVEQYSTIKKNIKIQKVWDQFHTRY